MPNKFQKVDSCVLFGRVRNSIRGKGVAKKKAGNEVVDTWHFRVEGNIRYENGSHSKTGGKKIKMRSSFRATIETRYDKSEAEDHKVTNLPEYNTCLADTNRSPANHLFTSFRIPSPMILLAFLMLF